MASEPVRMANTERRRWLVALKARLFPIMSRLFDRARPLPRSWSPARILVMQMQQLGDSAIFTATLRALRERFPDARIDMLASRTSHQLYAKCPYVTQFHVAHEWKAGAGGNALGRLLPLLRRIRRERYDLVIADIAQQSFKYSLISLATGAPVRVGFNINGRGFLHTMQVPYRPSASYFECNLDVARALGAAIERPREEVFFDADDVAHARSLLEPALVDDGPLVAIHAGSNWQSKTWFEDRWAALADRLVEQRGAHVVLVGTETDQAQAVIDRMRHPAISVVGRTNIPQLAALLSECDLFVGTDSGPRHIAGAVGTSVVMLMSAQEDTDNWIGFREVETVLRHLPPCRGCFTSYCSHRTCMNMIGLEDAVGSALVQLDRGARQLGAPGMSRVAAQR
jgi:heptosyltransferase-2